jgi:hypothetical protein
MLVQWRLAAKDGFERPGQERESTSSFGMMLRRTSDSPFGPLTMSQDRGTGRYGRRSESERKGGAATSFSDYRARESSARVGGPWQVLLDELPRGLSRQRLANRRSYLIVRTSQSPSSCVGAQVPPCTSQQPSRQRIHIISSFMAHRHRTTPGIVIPWCVCRATQKYRGPASPETIFPHQALATVVQFGTATPGGMHSAAPFDGLKHRNT